MKNVCQVPFAHAYPGSPLNIPNNDVSLGLAQLFIFPDNIM